MAGVAQVFGKIYHQASTDSLPALTGATTASHYGYFEVTADRQCVFYICIRARDENAYWCFLVDGGIGCIPSPVTHTKQDLTLCFLRQSFRE